MMRVPLSLVCLLLVCVAVPTASAGEDEPTPAEIAGMILDGNAGEHALVAAWLENADRATLRTVFAKLRDLRAARAKQVESRLTAVPLKARDVKRFELDDSKSPALMQGPLVNAEVRILEFPVDAAARILGRKRPTADRSWHLMDEAAVTTLMRAVERQEGAKVVSAPRITVYDEQKANVSVLNQVSYIRDYDVEVVGGNSIADPVVGIVQEGILIDFTPTCLPKSGAIRVAFEGTFSSLQRPIAEKQVELAGGSGQTVTIQLPQVEVGRIRETVEVADGGWVLMGGGVTFQAKQDGPRFERVALVHLRQLELDAIGEAKREK